MFGKDINREFTIDWDIICDFGNNVFDNYIEKLDYHYAQLTDLEKKIIILQKLGFCMPEIAAILEKSIHTLYKYSSTIRKKINIPEDESLIDFIDRKFKV